MPGIVDIIVKKREGKKLTHDEISEFVTGSLNGTVTREQIGSMLMAMYLKGLDSDETISMTKCMINSGETFNNWPKHMRGKLVDKHSTGGVGDKVSLVLAPALAACGLKVPMISGRGLGYTGGTLDKLESIPGYQVTQSIDDIYSKVDKVGAVIVGQTGDIVPADKMFYSIRDTTGTVESTPLIASSIMSKKMAEEVDVLVMELTFGRASLVPDEKTAREFGPLLISLGESIGMKVSAVLTKMDQPLGKTIGNSIEVIECIKAMKGVFSDDLLEVFLKLGSCLLCDVQGMATSAEEAESMLWKTITDGSAKNKFQEMIVEQGVDQELAIKLFEDDADFNKLLPASKQKTELKVESDGYVQDINALTCGTICMELGAGRSKPSDSINYGVGMEVLCRVGSQVKKGDVWSVVHHDGNLTQGQTTRLQNALQISNTQPSDTNNSRTTGVIRGKNSATPE